MKLLSLLFVTLLSINGCNQEKELASAVVEYSAHSRGFHQTITVSGGQLIVSSTNDKSDAVTHKLNDAEQKELASLFSEINLKQLPELKAPTEKRFYDGAAIAGLTVTYKDEVYTSASFDHGFPPSEIKAFVEKLTAIAETK